MNSIMTSIIIRAIISGRPHGLFLMKRVTHPNHGMRPITFPTTRFCGTPGGLLKSHGSWPVCGVCGQGFPFPSPFVWK